MVAAVVPAQDKEKIDVVNDIHLMYNIKMWGENGECELGARDNGRSPFEIIDAVSVIWTFSMTPMS